MYIDISVIQPLPSSNPNRDDTGSPKSAVFGGVRRHRVSSQAWKRAVRVKFSEELKGRDIGVRTKDAVRLVADKIAEISPPLREESLAMALECFKVAQIKLEEPSKKTEKDQVAKLKSLIFLSSPQVDYLAKAAIKARNEGRKVKKAEVAEALNGENSIDLALFGRMIAREKGTAPLNVDAACQVAHAISTHAVETEFDFYTAVDEWSRTDDGAGMMGTIEFVSSCLYRYATINVDQLVKNLDNEEQDARLAIEAFVKAFIMSMPTGKANTFANQSLPSGVYVALRDDQPMSLVAAFEKPVRPGKDYGYVESSADALVGYAQTLYTAYGAPLKEYVCVADQAAERLETLGDRVALKELAKAVAHAALPMSGQA